jgi:adenylate cyclase
MNKLFKSLLTTTQRPEWSQSVLLGLMFLLFVSNAIGLLEFKSDLLPGVSLRPEIFSTNSESFKLPDIMASGSFALLMATGLVLIIFLPAMTPVGASLLVFFLALPPLWLELKFPQSTTLVPMQFHWLVQMILFGINVLMKYFAETQEKQKLLDTFSQFVPPEIVSVLNHQSKKAALEGESRYLTVFFCDLRNFTSMSEQLDPREVVRLLNEYFTTMTTILYRYGATIDKYIGDSVMAFWGAPLPMEDHHKRAIQASFEMHKQMESLADIFHSRALPTPTIGIGINSGLMNVGNMGSRFRLAYTVIGDAVNLAARLQSATRLYRVNTIVGENTARLNRDMVFRELDTVAMKGKSMAERIYEPLCEQNELTPALEQKLAAHQKALDAWYNNENEVACRHFAELAASYPDDGYYVYMQQRCARVASTTNESTVLDTQA